MLGPLCVHGRDIRPSFNHIIRAGSTGATRIETVFEAPEHWTDLIRALCRFRFGRAVVSSATQTTGWLLGAKFTPDGYGPRGVPSPSGFCRYRYLLIGRLPEGITGGGLCEFHCPCSRRRPGSPNTKSVLPLD